jgi:hypothetical protein
LGRRLSKAGLNQQNSQCQEEDRLCFHKSSLNI